MMQPASFKRDFQKYLSENGTRVDLPKSIAQLAYYDQQAIPNVAGQQQVYFVGQVGANRTNLGNSFTRAQAEHMIITGIQVNDGNNAVIQDTDWATGSSLVPTKNATATVVVNGVTYLKDYPLVNASDETTDDTRGIVWLTEPIFWPGQTELRITVTFPSAGAASDNLRITVIGVGTVA